MRRTIFFTVFILYLFATAAAFADGIIIIYPPYPYPWPEPWPWPWRPIPKEAPRSLDIKYHHVDVQIDGQVCSTTVDEVFKNPYTVELEGTYIFPLPEGAAIDKFSLKIDGEEVVGEMLDADEAASAYRDMVRQNKDPAILEYVGRKAFRARIYPIPPQGEKRVEISYTEILPYDSGMMRYEYPLDTERFSPLPLEDVAINVTIAGDQPIKTVYSPTHNIATERTDTGATITYREEGTWPDRDFVLYFAPTVDDIAANLITDKPEGEDGYFMLLVTPPEPGDIPPQPKEVVFVMDTSGSMGGEKIEQVKEALKYCLNSLNPGDSFNLITFSDQPTLYSKTTVTADKENVRDAFDFVKDIKAAGGTNIDGALAVALETSDGSEKPVYILFLTDGKPTVGPRDAAEIIGNYKANPALDEERLFAFGVGYKVNADLLDALSSRNGGLTRYVEPGEDVEVAITNLYDKIAIPALTNLQIQYEGLTVYDIYPSQGDDLFAGTQLTVLGRYKNNFAGGSVTISGERNGEPVSLDYNLDAPVSGTRADFLGPLWATRKIGFYLDEIRLNGETEELVDEVVALSKQYGIVTPYTSYLVDDTKSVASGGRGEWRSGSFESDAVWAGNAMKYSGTSGGLTAPEAGIDMNITYTGRDIGSEDHLRVAESEAIGGMKATERVTGGASDSYIRQIHGKVFLQKNGVWVDLSIGNDRDKFEIIEMEFGSDEYFAFIENTPNAAPFLGLGEKVEFIFDGKIYSII